MASADPRAALADATGLVAAFHEICIQTRFSPDAVEAAFSRLRWKGKRLQSPSQAAHFSTWALGPAQVTVGYRPLGPGLVTYSCGIVVRGEAAAAAGSVRQALQTRFAPARLRPARKAPPLQYQARLEDEPNLQAILTFTGGRVPFARKGAVELVSGVLIDYTETRGPHARAAVGH